MGRPFSDPITHSFGCSSIRIDAKRQALDALDDLRRRAATNGNGKPENNVEIETIVEVADDLTSQ
jgi:hypothetical protein